MVLLGDPGDRPRGTRLAGWRGVDWLSVLLLGEVVTQDGWSGRQRHEQQDKQGDDDQKDDVEPGLVMVEHGTPPAEIGVTSNDAGGYTCAPRC